MDEMSLSVTKEPKKCIHSRKIQAFAQNPELPRFTMFKKHLMVCSTCQMELAKERELIANISEMIPDKSPLESQLMDIKSELRDSLKELNIVDRTSYRFRVGQKVHGLSAIFLATGKNLIRFKYLGIMFAAILAGVLLSN